MSDISITAANVVASSSAVIRRAIAGGTITAGQPIYLDSSDSYSAKAADADASASANVVGVALNGASDGQPVDYVVEDPSFTPGGTTTAGTPYFASTNAGGICPIADLASGDYVAFLGIGLSSNKLFLRIAASGQAI